MSASDSFVHLHVHTEYSLLDGAARLDEMVRRAGELGMPAIAITDHGNLHGAYDFHRLATGAGVKPIIGIEAYVAPGSRHDREPVLWGEPYQREDDVSAGGHYTHLTIWARDRTGLRNLTRLSSLAYTEGLVRRWARMDAGLIAGHAEGLMATTGCPSGEVQTRLRLGQEDEALKAAAKYQDIFGKDNFFLELMDHGLPLERRVRDGLVRVGRALRLPPLVTNDSHYTRATDAAAHDALLCVQTGKRLSDADRFRFGGSGYHVRSAAEMRALDSSELWAEGCRNTLLVAERTDPAGFFEPADLMPAYPVPAGTTQGELFRQAVREGLARRRPGGVDERRRAQAEHEIEVIERMGLPGYFLVVADVVTWAKAHGIRVGPGRGSVAGSLVAYAMGITDLDPVAHGLSFERFLNPGRATMPDIDLDFDERRRGEVIRYVSEKWGADKVALIVTFTTIKAKAAVKDAGRVLGHPYALGDRISKAFPPAVMGRDIPLSCVFDPDHPRHPEAGALRALYDQDPAVRQTLDLARGLEGLVRQTGVHAAGVIMSAEPLIDHIPVMRRDSDGTVITQFGYPACEALGLLKIDFLGLRNLTIIDDCLKMIGPEIDLAGLPLDDRATYELLGRGDTLGVFQLDGDGMRALLRLMRPDTFDDCSALIALYRPGPMGAGSHTGYALRKTGRQEITPIHEELEEPLRDVLGPTYGLIIYQEQVMAIARRVAGFTPGQADLLRHAMGKKDKAELAEQFATFAAGMRGGGFSEAAVRALWEVLVPFADYAFSKAHSAAYGLIAYWTAYLKANHPAAYMAALLSSVGDDKDKSALYLRECRRMGITVFPPDVNDSDAGFTPHGAGIRFGLSAVRNVGGNVVEGIVSARAEQGRFTSFADFLRKVPDVVCTRRVIESLVKAGAFDSLGHPRRGLTLVHEQAVEAIGAVKRHEAIGQDSLFGARHTFDVRIPAGEWDKGTLLRFEREMLGLYVSDHPLFGVEHVLAAGADCSVAAVHDAGREDGDVVTVGGIVSGITRKVSRRGESWVLARIEDLEGSVEVMILPAAYRLCSTILAEDAVVFVKGRVDRRDDVVRLVAMEVTVPDLSREPGPLLISLPLSRCTASVVGRLKAILAAHPGTSEVRLRVSDGSRTTVLRLGDGLRVTPSPALMGDLKQLLGPGCL